MFGWLFAIGGIGLLAFVGLVLLQQIGQQIAQAAR
jgi:hypothetical protein